MRATEIVLIVIGAFYTFAGYFASRAILTSLVVDRAIATLGATTQPRAQIAKTAWLLSVAQLVLLGGPLCCCS